VDVIEIDSTDLHPGIWNNINKPILECVQTSLQQGESIVVNISGSCMEPELRDGDRVTIESRSHYFPGDIVAYFSPYQETWLVHRFLGYVYADHGWKFMLMADTANKPDILVRKENIIGKAIATESDACPVRFSRRFQAITRYIFWVLKTGFGKVLSGNTSSP
jgi:signal peptidase I